MEEDWYADRIRLRQLLRAHPTWSHRAHADEIGRSVGWVKKWTKRVRAAPDDDQVVHGQSRARKHPPPPWDPRVIDRILPDPRAAPGAPAAHPGAQGHPLLSVA